MSIRDRSYLSDGFSNLEAGINSGRVPSIILKNQLSWAINTTVRGGYVQCRPGWKRLPLIFPDDTVRSNFQDGTFQFGWGFDPPGEDRDPMLVVTIGGRQFRIDVATDYRVSDISIPGDLNATQRQNFFQQAEDWLVIQDGQARPLIYDGASMRRAYRDEVPVGKQMAYVKGRLWVAKGRSYVAGDIYGGPSGTPIYEFRDAVLKFTENDYLAEGGAFAVPSQAGDITALAPLATPDTSLGQGDLVVFTEQSVFTNQVPVDRDLWKNLTYPAQTVVVLKYGASGQYSVGLVNGDIFFRAQDGIRSLIMAIREFTTWGNTPVSREVTRVIDYDDRQLLPFGSCVLFDNRILFTVSPYWTKRGVVHRGLVPLDFETISSINEKLPPAWEGLWTGGNILQILKQTIRGEERCFMFILNPASEIELWELTRKDRFDHSVERITWSIETGAYAFGNHQRKRLQGADIWVDRLAGRVSFDAKYRPDQYPCWFDWCNFEECGTINNCEDITPCLTFSNWTETYRPEIEIGQPINGCEAGQTKASRDAYEFQVRLEMAGFCRVKLLKLFASIQEKITQIKA